MKMQERECSNQGETLGMGFDSLKNILLPNSAIDLSNVNEDSIQSEQVPVEESCSFAHIENEAMLSKSLSLSANIDFKIGGEGSGLDIPCILSASAKGGFSSWRSTACCAVAGPCVASASWACFHNVSAASLSAKARLSAWASMRRSFCRVTRGSLAMAA